MRKHSRINGEATLAMRPNQCRRGDSCNRTGSKWLARISSNREETIEKAFEEAFEETFEKAFEETFKEPIKRTQCWRGDIGNLTGRKWLST